MSKENYAVVAKKLGIKYRIGKYGINFLPRDPYNHIRKLWEIVPLSGWIFNPHEIKQAIADDPAFSISYAKRKK